MITPYMAVAMCTVINLSIVILNFILTVHNIHAMNDLEAEKEENKENE